MQYEASYLRCLLIDDAQKAEKISQTYLRTEHASQDHHAITWRAFRLLSLIRNTNEGSLENLKNLAQANPDIEKVQESLGFAYAHYDQFVTAAAIFEGLASRTSDERERTRLLGFAAVWVAKAGNTERAAQIIEEMKRPTDERQTEKVVNIMGEVAEVSEDRRYGHRCSGVCYWANPGDIGSRFLLAFKHAARGNREVALMHYLKIPANDGIHRLGTISA